MNINVSNEFIVVGSFFFLVSWFLTTLFMRSGAFFRVVIFALSTALFMTLEHLESIELTVISFVAAVTAYYGGVMSLFSSLYNRSIDSYYWLKDISSFISYSFQLIASGIKQTIIFIISVFQPKGRSEKNQKSSHSSKQHRKRNNKNNSQNYEEKKQKAKEQFRQAREEAEQEKIKKSHSTHHQDARTFEEILGLDTNFTQAELKMAYKRASSRFHPDKYSHMSEAFRIEAEEEFKKVQRAYKILTT